MHEPCKNLKVRASVGPRDGDRQTGERLRANPEGMLRVFARALVTHAHFARSLSALPCVSLQDVQSTLRRGLDGSPPWRSAR